MRLTPTKLADGRDLFYFDDSEPYVSGQATRRLDDLRPLTQRSADSGPMMRHDPLTGDWIAMASYRMDRTFQPATTACPLCPAQAGAAYQDGEIPDTGYDVVVFENRFPSLWRPPGQEVAVTAEGVHANPRSGLDAGSCDFAQDDQKPASDFAQDDQKLAHARAALQPTNQATQDQTKNLDANPLWPVAPAAGRCEVICFSPDHWTSVGQLPATRMRTIIDALALRTAALQQLDGIQQVFAFENRGQEIGVTLPHPHGQIYAYPFLPPRTAQIMRQAKAYQERTGRHLLADVTAAEIAAGHRMVCQSDHWVAYVPAAARWPVEVHLAPRQDHLDLTSLSPAERDDLARLYPQLLRGLDHYFRDANGAPMALPYVAGWHQAPTDPDLRPLGRLHLQLFSIRRAPDKLKYLAGSESGLAAWICDTTPEQIAERAREALSEANHG